VNPVILIAAALFAYGIYRNATNFMAESYFSFSGISFQNRRIVLTINWRNNSNAALRIESVSGQAVYKNQIIGTYITTAPITIQPRTTTKFSVQITPEVLSTITTLFQAVRNINTGLGSVRLVGGVTTTLGRVAYDYEYSIDQNFNFIKPLLESRKPAQ
jgi:hypothetical protein